MGAGKAGQRGKKGWIKGGERLDKEGKKGG